MPPRPCPSFLPFKFSKPLSSLTFCSIINLCCNRCFPAWGPWWISTRVSATSLPLSSPQTWYQHLACLRKLNLMLLVSILTKQIHGLKKLTIIILIYIWTQLPILKFQTFKKLFEIFSKTLGPLKVNSLEKAIWKVNPVQKNICNWFWLEERNGKM